MIDDYVRTKIEDALAATDDNRHNAQKLLITWAVRDQTLLLGMTKPHLKAISASLVEHMMRSDDKGSGDSGPDHFTPSAINDIIASNGVTKDKRTHRNLPPPKSTERQATTMRKLAAAFTRKKK
jgi:hypothetical protein